MFTGIVEEVGAVRAVRKQGRAAEIEIAGQHVLDDVKIGDSICVNGVCLTVTRLAPGSFCADVSPETLACSSLGSVRSGDGVNLERAVRSDGRFGGHFVTGHVDTTGVVTDLRADANAFWLCLRCGTDFARHLVAKGSVSVDGVSLTVARLWAGGFDVAMIPHTADGTTLGKRRRGDTVNLEADILAKYVEGLLGLSGRTESMFCRAAGQGREASHV